MGRIIRDTLIYMAIYFSILMLGRIWLHTAMYDVIGMTGTCGFFYYLIHFAILKVTRRNDE